jgi:uncharacterized membrane protein YoaK (UPF0700 family)
MSGNSVRIGTAGATGNASEILRRGWPVAFFTAGLMASALVHEIGARRRFLSTSAIIFGLEAALLGCVQIFYINTGRISASGPQFFAPAALLAFAMGVQNATLTKVGALSVRTTHITGTISEFVEGFSQFIFWMFDRLRGTGARRRRRILAVMMRQRSFQQAVLTALLWISFVVGAFCGTMSMRQFHAYLLVPPIIALVVFLTLDVLRPLAASAEHKARLPLHDAGKARK